MPALRVRGFRGSKRESFGEISPPMEERGIPDSRLRIAGKVYCVPRLGESGVDRRTYLDFRMQYSRAVVRMRRRSPTIAGVAIHMSSFARRF